MGTGEMPLLVPVTRSVSASISRRTSSKSVNFFPLQCRNSAYSAPEGAGRGGESIITKAYLGLISHWEKTPHVHTHTHTHTHKTLPYSSSPDNKASSPLGIFIPAVQMRNEVQRGEAHTCSSIDQLQDQGASRDNARSSGQEVPAVN